MANRIRTGDPREFNKGCSSKFRKDSRVRQTPEEGWRTYQPKLCGNNNKHEDNSPKTLNDKNSSLLIVEETVPDTFRTVQPVLQLEEGDVLFQRDNATQHTALQGV